MGQRGPGKRSEKSKTLSLTALAIGLGLLLTSPAFGDQITLLFPSLDAHSLVSENRSIEIKAGLGDQAREIILALLKGPRTRLAPVFGPGEHLRQVFVSQEGIAYVDLAESAVKGLDAGVVSERLRLWSLVNSICINLEAVTAVKILVGGQEVPTLMGHVDISRPLYPDFSLIKENGQQEKTE